MCVGGEQPALAGLRADSGECAGEWDGMPSEEHSHHRQQTSRGRRRRCTPARGLPAAPSPQRRSAWIASQSIWVSCSGRRLLLSWQRSRMTRCCSWAGSSSGGRRQRWLGAWRPAAPGGAAGADGQLSAAVPPGLEHSAGLSRRQGRRWIIAALAQLMLLCVAGAGSVASSADPSAPDARALPAPGGRGPAARRRQKGRSRRRHPRRRSRQKHRRQRSQHLLWAAVPDHVE